MGYLLYNLSCINVVNGLNFTREQAVKLKACAAEMEASGFDRPRLAGRFSPDFEKVRSEFLRTREILLSGKTADGETMKRMGEARKTESAAIKAGLVWDPSKRWGACQRCHSESEAATETEGLGRRWEGLPGGTAKEKAVAHLLGCYDEQRAAHALTALKKAAVKIDAVLTDEQKEIFRSFSCCLLPPADLEDPVRVGQAQASPLHAKILSAARTSPSWAWPGVRSRIIEGLVGQALVVKPGLTEKEKAGLATAAGAVLDKARSLTDIEFELEKDALASELKSTGGTQAATPGDHLPFMRAFFLMVPGATEVYDALIRRIDEAATSQKGRPRDLAKEKPASEGG